MYMYRARLAGDVIGALPIMGGNFVELSGEWRSESEYESSEQAHSDTDVDVPPLGIRIIRTRT